MDPTKRRVAIVTVHDAGSTEETEPGRSVAELLVTSGAEPVVERRITLAASADGETQEAFSSACFTGRCEGVEFDVYELTWSDLSKSKPTAMSILRQLLGLAPRFLQLGRRALAETSGAGASRTATAWVFDASAWLLGWVLPAANAALLLVAALAAALGQSPGRLTAFALGLTTVVSLLTAGWVTYRTQGTLPSFGPLARMFLIAVVLGAGIWFGSGAWFGDLRPNVLTAAGTAAVAVAALAWALTRVLTPATRARTATVPVLLALAVVAVHSWAGLPPSPIWGSASLQAAAESIASFIAAAWTLTAGLGLAIHVSALGRPRSDEARRASRTARWGFGFYFSALGFAQFFVVEVLRQLTPEIGLSPFVTTSKTHFVFQLLSFAWPAITALLIASFVVASLTVFLPSVVLELSGKTDSNPAAAARLGRWLTAGRRSLAVLATWTTPLFICGAPLLFVLSWFSNSLNATLFESHGRFWHWALPAGVALVLGALRSPAGLNELWPVLSVALDFDTHMRDDAASERASIDARGRALLGHIEGREAAYSRVHVVAHGQGTLVAASVLALDDWPGGDPRHRVTLLTMGSPLRALHAELLPTTIASLLRKLEALRWHNLFWAGDYLGRSLWQDEADPLTYTRPWSRGLHSEQCLGAGAHRQYWSSPELRKILIDQINGAP